MKKYLLTLTAFASSVIVGSAQILQFDFDNPTYTASGATQPGSGALSSGSSATEIGFQNAFGGFPRGDGQTSLSGSNFYVQNGVSGQAGDYSFRVDTDLMGDSTAGGGGAQSMARTTSTVSALNNLTSFTITGWFQTADTTQFGNFARLFDNYDNANGFRLRNNGTNGTLQLTVQTSSLEATGYTATQDWVFFAASYDASTDAAALYIGSKTVAASVANSGNIVLAGSNTGSVTENLAIGNTSGSGRPFNGFLDDIRVYGSTVDGSGVLNLAAIESVRASAIPEPSSFALLGGCLALALVSLRRRR